MMVYQEMEDAQRCLSVTGSLVDVSLMSSSTGRPRRYLCSQTGSSRPLVDRSSLRAFVTVEPKNDSMAYPSAEHGGTPPGRDQRYCHDQRIPLILPLRHCGDGLQ